MLVTMNETETEPPSSLVRQTPAQRHCQKIMSRFHSASGFHWQPEVTQIVRFLLERGLRFRNLDFCGHDLM